MRRQINITDTDSVTPEVPRDQQDVGYVANEMLGFHPTDKRLVSQLQKVLIILPVAALANLANSQVLKIPVPFPFILNSVAFRVGDKAVTTAAKTATVQVQISGTPCIGGTVALVSADLTPSGAKKDLSAITALNVGAADATLEIAVSAVTAFAEGDGWFEFNVTRKTA
jgi:hypothetical protein